MWRSSAYVLVLYAVGCLGLAVGAESQLKTGPGERDFQVREVGGDYIVKSSEISSLYRKLLKEEGWNLTDVKAPFVTRYQLGTVEGKSAFIDIALPGDVPPGFVSGLGESKEFRSEVDALWKEWSEKALNQCEGGRVCVRSCPSDDKRCCKWACK